MPLFQAKRTHPVTKEQESVYIDAPDRTAAIVTLRSHGWAAAEWLDSVPPGSDVPEDATILEADPRLVQQRKRREGQPKGLEDSWIIQRPVWTIAYGIVLGWVLVTIIKLVFALVGGLFGVAFFGWSWN